MVRKVIIALAAVAFVGAVAASTTVDARMGGMGGGGFRGGGGFHAAGIVAASAPRLGRDSAEHRTAL